MLGLWIDSCDETGYENPISSNKNKPAGFYSHSNLTPYKKYMKRNSILHIKTKKSYAPGRSQESIDRQKSWESFERNVLAPSLKWRKMTDEEKRKYGIKNG